MSSFHLQVSRVQNNIQTIYISGEIDEKANFRKFIFPVLPKIHLDLEKVKAINIHGIKKWKDWFQNILSKPSVFLFKCPPCIVFQFNTIEDFLLPNIKVQSFYVPYYNSKSNRRKNILFRKNHEFKKNQLMIPDVVQDEYGEEMEMDVDEQIYFSFLFESN